MIKLLLFAIAGMALSYGTLLVTSNTEIKPYACGPACDAIAELSDKGFPVEFVSEDFDIANSDKVSDFDFAAYALNSLIWMVIAFVAFNLATFVLAQFGVMILGALAIAYIFGYSATLFWL